MKDIVNKKIKLSLSIDEAKLLYNGVRQERKEELEKFFPELKPQPIIDRVKTYEDALEVLGRSYFKRTNLYPRETARRKLEIIIEALNEGWKPDFNDIKQSKWYCYFDGSNAGLGYSISISSPAYAAAHIGVRLCLKSKELADYCRTQFKLLYEIMLLG